MIDETTLFKRYLELVPNAKGITFIDDTNTNLKFTDGNGKELENPLQSEIDAVKEKWDEDMAKENYKKQRASEYPLIHHQLDMIYNDEVNGTTTWKDAIKAIKDKYPKE